MSDDNKKQLEQGGPLVIEDIGTSHMKRTVYDIKSDIRPQVSVRAVTVGEFAADLRREFRKAVSEHVHFKTPIIEEPEEENDDDDIGEILKI